MLVEVHLLLSGLGMKSCSKATLAITPPSNGSLALLSGVLAHAFYVGFQRL